MVERKALKVAYASGEIKEIVFSISRGDPCVVEMEEAARLDAYPSGMARDMAKGSKVYLLRMGEQARLEDVVNTFDEAPIELVASVEDQRRYYLAWSESRKQ